MVMRSIIETHRFCQECKEHQIFRGCRILYDNGPDPSKFTNLRRGTAKFAGDRQICQAAGDDAFCIMIFFLSNTRVPVAVLLTGLIMRSHSRLKTMPHQSGIICTQVVPLCRQYL